MSRVSTGLPESVSPAAAASAPAWFAHSADALQRTLDECRRGFELRQVPAAAAEHWSVIDGALQHRSRGFFSAQGVTDGATSALMLYQPQAAVTGVLSARVAGGRAFLLQARAEPGCLGEAQFGPTVQSTPANYLRLHGGASTPYVDSFIASDPRVAVLDDTTQLDLGERYLAKCKRSILLETQDLAAPLPSFVWAAPEALAEAVLRSAFLNIDLRSVLSVTRWSAEPGAGELAPRSAAVRHSLAAPPRADALGALMAQLHRAAPQPMRFVPLAELENWRATAMGWSERVPRQGFSVDFFQVKAAFREVGSWVQPLVNSATEGQVILACRERGGLLEFCVRPVAERGLATAAALAPSYLRYPGSAGQAPAWLRAPAARIWSHTIESDEGGRFYRDASAYQIVRTDDAAEPEPADGAWLRLSELKVMLRSSNVCTIQLRGIVSHLLGLE